MAETENIARMAAKVSTEVFRVFGWESIGPVNHNWTCVSESHAKKTHPSDVVLAYDDPYRAARVIWNVDLKSYAAGTIKKQNLATAIANMSKAIECANVSADWQHLYAGEGNFRCDGLIFIYNHDGDFAGDFQRVLDELDEGQAEVPPNRRISVVGPSSVEHLINVAHDIVSLRGTKQIPLEEEAIEFWYPDLVRPRRHPQTKSAATIEMLTGPWITIQVSPEYNNGLRSFIVYYKGKGDSVDEFIYLLDSFFRFQILAVDRHASITVRLIAPDEVATINFEKAKSAMSTSLYNLSRDTLKTVNCETITHVSRRFSEIAIGMEER